MALEKSLPFPTWSKPSGELVENRLPLPQPSAAFLLGREVVVRIWEESESAEDVDF